MKPFSVSASATVEKPYVSVIIPVFRDWERLGRCVNLIEKQSLARDAYEIIVVSNEPDSVAVNVWQRSHPSCIILHEPRGYSYAARNAGIRHARGHFLAFTDSDCLPQAGWLEAGVNEMRDDDMTILGGCVQMVGAETTAAADFDRIFGISQPDFLERHGGFATANLFTSKTVVGCVGGFDPSLPSSGDFEFCRRAWGAGVRLRYAAMAVVEHPVRARADEVLKKQQRVERGKSLLLEMEGGGIRKSQLRSLLGTWRGCLLGREQQSAHLRFLRRVRLVGFRIWLHWSVARSVTRRADEIAPERERAPAFPPTDC